MFGALKKAFGAGAREVQANYSQNKDYLEAVCAASALPLRCLRAGRHG